MNYGQASGEGAKTSRINLLNLPGLGRFLRWRWARLSLQLMLAFLAALILYDGFTGDPLASRNLATVTLWVHFRGLVVLALLLVGNLFCMACPFTLVRSVARGRGLGRLKWPTWLRNKYVALASLFGLLFAYEALDLWRSPLLTAWLAVAYFGAGFVAELLFEGSPFCKYVCPLGSFNTLYSTLSPVQLRVNNPQTCLTCVGKECLNGSATVAGCGTSLFVPQITQQVDCVLCLDCVRACPHNNVLLTVQPPARALHAEPFRERLDLGLLIVCLCFMAVANAFGMTPPIYGLLKEIQEGLLGGNASQGTTGALFIVFGMLGLVLPVMSAFGAAWLSRWLSDGVPSADLPGHSGAEGSVQRLTPEAPSVSRLVGRFAPAFLPLGFAIWWVHYQFHFLTGALTLIPVTHAVLIDHGWMSGRPDFSLAELVRPSALHGVEVAGVAIGFVVSFSVLWSLGLKHCGTRARAARAILPWAVVLLLVAGAAVRIFGYPMEMRGVSGGLGGGVSEVIQGLERGDAHG